ncbi:hypothetical protein SAMN05444373_10844 [Thermoclostridium caenicola]|uniref:Uncharacterized protein n=2 Tax=Thermoclostridium caenicola TaxID=659425 RepID=A0A1M6KLD4_9FIRM|nr:hypothetical protein SAMN05444373_10844 [Thermoclostridium caenicola]
MKVLMKSVDMICLSSREGEIRPLKFRIQESNGEFRIVKIDRVISKKEEKTAGNRMLVFTVQSVMDGVERIYEMKYEIQTTRWYLYKL